jgi:hypothetical protein
MKSSFVPGTTPRGKPNEIVPRWRAMPCGNICIDELRVSEDRDRAGYSKQPQTDIDARL